MLLNSGKIEKKLLDHIEIIDAELIKRSEDDLAYAMLMQAKSTALLGLAQSKNYSTGGHI